MKLEDIVRHLVEEILAEATRESLNEIWLDEAEYPEAFSFDELKSQKSKAATLRYLTSHFGQKLGKGSARIVFPVDNATVLKVALNEKGVAQNNIEIDAGNIGYECIAQVYDSDDEGMWLEMERAEPFRKKSEWPKLIGLPVTFEQWAEVLFAYVGKHMRGATYSRAANINPELIEQIQESELFSDVVGMIANHDMAVGDMTRVSSWGVVLRNGKRTPVLIDYGITPEILKKHYWGGW